ncbi:MAG: VCBS domain-containing protein, partial [Planctomycetota bacterium]|nr:VCBS domain-containing protein [Planctomycetota bacterium]
ELFTIQVIDATGLTAQAIAEFVITGSADAPTVTAGPASNGLVEAGALVLGVSNATASLTFSSPDSTVTIDTAWLELNGWITADAGLTYTTAGTYGTATLDISTAIVTYFLDDALPATNALAQDQAVSELFTVQVIDATGLTAQATAEFAITGSNDVPTVTAAPASNGLVEAGFFVAGVNTATVALTLTDVDGTVAIDVPWLESFGWNTGDGGLTYTHGGDYGIATIDMVTGIISYLLLDALPVTDALIAGETVLDPFTIQVIDNGGAVAEATAIFTVAGTDLPSAFTANVAGYASVSSANPTAATLGILNPANTLLISIPAEAGAIDILNVQWEWFDINTNAWISIQGANSLTYIPNDFDAVPLGSVIHAVAEYTDGTSPLIITSVQTAPLGVEMVGTLANDAFLGTIFQDVIYGGDGNEFLDGNLGADYLAGGVGNDTYVVDDVADVVVENPGEGIDTIQSSISWILGADVENLALIGPGTINGTGNALDNELVGNGLDNILIGGVGADTLTGGSGVDTFRLTSLTDSLAASMDTITDFVVGTDVLDAPTALARNRITQVAIPGTFSVATLEFLLAGNNLLANRGAMVTFGGSATEAYLVLNDGIAGYNPAIDAVIRIRYTGRITRFIVT